MGILPTDKADELIAIIYDHVNCWTDEGECDYEKAQREAVTCALKVVKCIAHKNNEFWNDVYLELLNR